MVQCLASQGQGVVARSISDIIRGFYILVFRILRIHHETSLQFQKKTQSLGNLWINDAGHRSYYCGLMMPPSDFKRRPKAPRGTRDRIAVHTTGASKLYTDSPVPPTAPTAILDIPSCPLTLPDVQLTLVGRAPKMQDAVLHPPRATHPVAVGSTIPNP